MTRAKNHLQTSYDHYKCLVINKNGLLLPTNMLFLRILEHVSNLRKTRKMLSKIRTPKNVLRIGAELHSEAHLQAYSPRCESSITASRADYDSATTPKIVDSWLFVACGESCRCTTDGLILIKAHTCGPCNTHECTLH